MMAVMRDDVSGMDAERGWPLGLEAWTDALTRRLAADALPHALLLTGPPSIGKATWMHAFASLLLGVSGRDALLQGVTLGESASGDSTADASPSVTGAVHHAQPDLRWYKPRDAGAGNLQIDTVRDEILPFSRYAPFGDARAVVILEDVERLFPAGHREAANALLKTLEEPRPGLHFLLSSSAPRLLLDTIRSRCVALRAPALSMGTLQTLGARFGLEGEALVLAVSLCGGRADRLRAWALGEGEMAEQSSRLLAMADDAWPGLLGLDPVRWLSWSASHAGDEDLDETLQIMGWLMRDAAWASRWIPSINGLGGATEKVAQESAGPYRGFRFPQAAETRERLSKYPLRTLLRCTDEIAKLRGRLQWASTNRQLALEALWSACRC